MTIDLIVGSYAGSGGTGLYPLSYDPAAGRWSVEPPIAGVRNASYGVQGATHLYMVAEGADGAVAAYRGPADAWHQTARAPSGGDAPCHLALHPSGRWLAVANYGSGSVAVLALDRLGVPSGPVALHHNQGHGPDPQRQQSAHAHWVGFDAAGTTLYCVDLGCDRVLAFAFDSASGVLGDPATAYAAPAGSGPRHLLFHPRLPLAYLISEMAATLTLLERDGVRLVPRAVLPTLPGGGAPGTIVGGMALDRTATRLYVTNRGDDSVALFALDADGMPRWVARTPSGGRSPRFVFLLDDVDRLLVAHEGGETVTAFTIAHDGRLADPVAIAIPGAAFIASSPPAG